MKFNAIDLFAGAGGLSLGLEKAGFNIVLANEINKDCAETYSKNHLQTLMINKDIKDVNFEEEVKKIGFHNKINLIAGACPCQGFSTVGKKNEQDERNDLFREYIRVVKSILPDFVLFENVSGFKAMYKGRIFNCLCEEFHRLGYETKYEILNAVNFGLPQSRKRTIIVGFRKNMSFTMPEGSYGKNQDHEKKNSFRILRDAISDLPKVESGEESKEYLCAPKNEYQKELRGNEVILTEHFVSQHGESILNVLSKVPYGGSILNVPQELRPKGYFGNTYARLEWEKPTPTLTRNFGSPSSSRCVHPELNRGLTTREGARVQGFPDSYVFAGKKGSKNLQIGNAVPPLLGYEIGNKIHQSLLKYCRK